LFEHRSGALRLRRAPLTLRCFHSAPPGDWVRIVKLGYSLVEAVPVPRRQAVKKGAVGRHAFEQFGCGAEMFQEYAIGNICVGQGRFTWFL